MAEFSTFEVTIFGMGTERLRFLRGGSVVRPHVMPFNLEWMKNMYVSNTLFRYFNLLCFDGKFYGAEVMYFAEQQVQSLSAPRSASG